MATATRTSLKVADEVWIATALLHRDHPEAQDFAVEEIVQRAEREALHRPLRRGVYVHVIQHCVANRPPNPGRYRMLLETSPGRRRLFRKGDSYHPDREGERSHLSGKTCRTATTDCSLGIVTGRQLRVTNFQNKIRCFCSGVQVSVCGLANTPTIMYAACAKVGSEVWE